MHFCDTRLWIPNFALSVSMNTFYAAVKDFEIILFPIYHPRDTNLYQAITRDNTMLYWWQTQFSKLIPIAPCYGRHVCRICLMIFMLVEHEWS